MVWYIVYKIEIEPWKCGKGSRLGGMASVVGVWQISQRGFVKRFLFGRGKSQIYRSCIFSLPLSTK